MSFSITELPLYQDTFYRYTINLEGLQRTFNYYWNERAGAWHFDVKNADGTPVILGQALVAQYPIVVDYPLKSESMTGYFLLLPNNPDTRMDPLESSVVPQFFKFYYLYQLPE